MGSRGSKPHKRSPDLAYSRSCAGQKLVIEVKSFVGASKIQDLKEALGQYDIYRYLLEEIAPERKLYLAVGAIA
ncbi:MULTISPECIES: XisH family protein [unclassified Nostoc]|uniref:XisH family protein n=1 Tax=unclassified Nostoc TaxID=2593658 RepID=UPI001CB964CA|nr:XisH family protein [Nostoc sp. 'Peltigera membranacea cyanobiont' 232]